MLLYLIIGALVVTAATIARYQLALKKYQRDMRGGGTISHEEVVSLDEEEIEAKQFKNPPSKVYMFGCMAITAMLLVWFVTMGDDDGGGEDGSITYDDLGIKAMCSQLLSIKSEDRGIRTLLILSPKLYVEYVGKEEGKNHPLIDDIVKETLGKGKRYDIIGVEPSVSIAHRIVDERDNDLTPTGLRDIMRKHEDAQVVVALVGFHKECGEEVPVGRDRSFYLAVFSNQARLYEYLDLARLKAFDLAVMSNGLYNKNTVIPSKPSQDELVKKNFLFITPQNESHYRGAFRQVTMKNADIP